MFSPERRILLCSNKVLNAFSSEWTSSNAAGEVARSMTEVSSCGSTGVSDKLLEDSRKRDG